MDVIELGSCSAILSGIATKADGSLKITIEVNPTDREVINKLMERWAINERLLQVAFLGMNQ